MDFYEARQAADIAAVKAALAEAGWPDAEVVPQYGPFGIHVECDKPGTPPLVVAQQAIDLLNARGSDYRRTAP